MKQNAVHAGWIRLAGVLLIGAMTSSFVLAEGLTKYVVLKVTELDGSASYKMMTLENAKVLENEIQKDARYHAAALRKAQKAWKEDKDTGNTMFPRRAVSPRKVKIQGTPYRTEEEASKKLDRYTEQQSEKDAEEMKAAKRRTNALRRDPDGKEARKLRREEEADQKMAKARAMYEAALAEVKNAAENKK